MGSTIQVFQELEYEECSEDTCIMRVQEMLQVENVFNLQIIGEGKDSQLNLKWITLDEKKNETDVCLGCGTFQLNDKVRGLVEKLVGEKPIVVRVVRKEKGILFRDTPYTKFFEGGEKWIKFGDEETQVKFEGEIVDGVPNGEGTENFPNGQKYFGEFKDGLPNGQGMKTFPDGKKYFGEWKDGREWNTKHTKKDGTLIGKFENRKWILMLGVLYVGERNGKFGYFTEKWEGLENEDNRDIGKYEGEIKNGFPNGQGTFTLNDGEKYVGEFKDGLENGQGTYTWSIGDEYIGEYKDDKRWNGIYYDQNGNSIGKYVNGKEIKQ